MERINEEQENKRDDKAKHERRYRAINHLITFRPTPSRLLSLACEPYIVPRPQGGGMSEREQDSRAGGIMRLRAMRACRAALSLSLIHYSPFIAWACYRAVFVSSFWRSVAAYIHEGGGVGRSRPSPPWNNISRKWGAE